jgi:hypothetical protein
VGFGGNSWHANTLFSEVLRLEYGKLKRMAEAADRSRPYAEIRVKCGHIARNLLNKRALLSCIFMHCDVNLLIFHGHILAAF